MAIVSILTTQSRMPYESHSIGTEKEQRQGKLYPRRLPGLALKRRLCLNKLMRVQDNAVMEEGCMSHERAAQGSGKKPIFSISRDKREART
ncbi:hypothetical protein PM082_014187 [Marasmius tenuissimus]|nr:hypothetical protein PM082_014187 [Marasmius tenuissimus]